MRKNKKCKTCNFHIDSYGICAGLKSGHFGHAVDKNHWCKAWKKIGKEKMKILEMKNESKNNGRNETED